MRLYSILATYLLIIVSLLSMPTFVHAAKISYNLIAPTQTLTRGGDVPFTISIDTKGTKVTNGQVGLTYDTKYLQYVGATPGDAMPAIDVVKQADGKLVINGSNTSGFTGQGTFATITFKLIADSPGSTELCSLFAPETTPTPTVGTNSPTPTKPLPTSIPKTGQTDQTNTAIVMGLIFLIGAVGFFTIKTA